jgi:hypothetical protein
MTPAICNVCVCPHHFQTPSCSTSLLKLLGYSTSAQGVFEIQVKIFNPPSFGITKNLLLMNEDIKEYKTQVRLSMLFALQSQVALLTTEAEYISLSMSL